MPEEGVGVEVAGAHHHHVHVGGSAVLQVNPNTIKFKDITEKSYFNVIHFRFIPLPVFFF